MEDTLECTKVALELEDTDQPLRVSTSMFIAIPIKGSWELILILISKENNVFAKILLDTTIWDGSKKERSNIELSSIIADIRLIISINTNLYMVYNISLEAIWWALSNTSLIMGIYSVIPGIITNETCSYW